MAENRNQPMSQEALLLDYLQRLDKHRAGRKAVYIHLSGLLPHNRRDHHIRLAANTFETLVKALHGQIFVLSNTDLLFLFKVAVSAEVEAALVKLRFLFGDDPLLADEMAGRQGAFVTWYDVDKNYDDLIQLARKLVAEQERRRAPTNAGKTGPAQRRPGGEPLNPRLLAKLEDALCRADLTNLLRRQSVCVVLPNQLPQPIFSEVFVSISDLRATIAPTLNVAADPWLFQHLTETLDRRVLALLVKNDDRTLSGDISINLNVATLLSPEFLAFDDNISASMRGTVVLELQKTDLYADLGAYMFVRDFTHERGYRLCIDGLNHLTLPFVDRERLGADMVKIVWDADMARNETLVAQLTEAVKRSGPARTILCRCDDARAIEFGQRLGLTLFQGRHIENVLAAERARKAGPLAARRR
ncbi:MAG: hypothetical protein H3C38_10445 [Rhodospirillales bacterium]|nr:hypothetical protein [Rhodospirillales bacterium]